MLKYTQRCLPALALFAALAASGCVSVGPDYREPEPEVAESFTQADDPGFGRQDPVAEAWWEQFDDATLNSLIDKLIQNNPDVRIALANLRLARARRSSAFLDLFPEVTSGASFIKRRFSPAEFDGPGGASVELDLYQAGFDARWELDLFGRVRGEVAARRAEFEAAEAGRRGTLVSAIAELTRNYFELRGIQEGLTVARGLADNRREFLRITEAMVDNGRGNELDIAQAKAELSGALAVIPPLEADAQRAIHRIAVLCGETPDKLGALLKAGDGIPAFNFPVALDDPTALLRRRPDVRAAERRLAADTARIRVATADLFPRVQILGSVGLAADSPSDFDESASRVFSIGPFITWPALDLFDVRARIRAADAGAEASLVEYEKTVLVALEETENALVEFARNKQRRSLLTKAYETSREAVEIADQRHEAGLDDYLKLIETRNAKLQARGRLIASRTDTAAALVAVFKALGTGWQTASLPGDLEDEAPLQTAASDDKTPDSDEPSGNQGKPEHDAAGETGYSIDRWFRDRAF